MSGLIQMLKAAKAAETAGKEGKVFYSAADEAAKALARGKGTGKEFVTELRKTPGVKATELAERKLGEIEAMPKMSKEAFLAEMEKRSPKQITETVKRELNPSELNDHVENMIEKDATEIVNDELGKRDRFNREEWDEMHQDIVESKTKYEIDEYIRQVKEAADVGDLPDMPKYANPDYKLPGGENYREILLRLPSFSDADSKKLMELEAKRRRMGDWTPSEEVAKVEGQINTLRDKQLSYGRPFIGGHWDEPNVLAHMRVQDRTGPNGEKVLHVEEIQSDWHQKGRKEGYHQNTGDIDRYAEYEKGLADRATQAIAKNFEEAGSSPERALELAKKMVQSKQMTDNGLGPYNMANILGEKDKLDELWKAAKAEREAESKLPPEAPYKKNWHELAMKRLINYAAENGYDKVAITPGAQQASRYDLSKHINKISYGKNPDGTYSLTAIDKSGSPVINNMHLSEQELENTVGKDVAQKIIDGHGTDFPAGSVSEGKKALSGLDLQVGGEGMQGFYDKMLPDYLNKFGKEYGVSVGKMPISIGTAEDIERGAKENMAELHSFDITPEMRAAVKGKGMPLYQQIGIPTGAAAAGEEIFEDKEPGFAQGGPVGGQYDTDPDMSDGGQIIQGDAFKRGGRVNISHNIDTMFMELNDKKFKGK